MDEAEKDGPGLAGPGGASARDGRGLQSVGSSRGERRCSGGAARAEGRGQEPFPWVRDLQARPGRSRKNKAWNRLAREGLYNKAREGNHGMGGGGKDGVGREKNGGQGKGSIINGRTRYIRQCKGVVQRQGKAVQGSSTGLGQSGWKAALLEKALGVLVHSG